MPIRPRMLVIGALAFASVAISSTTTTAAQTAPPPTPQALTPPPFDAGTTPPPPTQHPATRPEQPSLASARAAVPAVQAAASSASGCPSLRYCAWTGGYFTGPSISFIVGHSYNWRNYRQSACTRSGISGGNWSNCASSTRNRSGYATTYYFALAGGRGFYLKEGPGRSHQQLGVFNNNIDSSVAF